MDYNNIGIIGRLTRDVELKYLPDGKAVATLSIAVNEINDKVSFFDIVVFGKVAENCSKYIGKGSQILCSGRLKQDSWQTDAGEKRHKIKIIANHVQFLSKGKQQAETPQNNLPPEDTNIPESIDETASLNFQSPIDDSENIPF